MNDRKDRHAVRSLISVRPMQDGLVEQDGRKLVNFCSNDYLGLSLHPNVIKSSQEHIAKYGAGSGASRLITGTFECHDALENELASFLKRESALVFNSGFQLNSTIIPALSDRETILYFDKLNHNSLYQGAHASRASLRRYNHADADHLRRLLERDSGLNHRKIIVTESVFSMNGDCAPLIEIADLAESYNAILVVDEAHAIGVLGEAGRGLACDIERVDILIGTFGKAFGASGAYVAGSKRLREYFINFCAGFIYTTSIPPAAVGAIRASLNLIPVYEQQRNHVIDLASSFRSLLSANGFTLFDSTTHIVPVWVGGEQDTLNLSETLRSHGYLVQPIRPPTVEEGTSRLRFTIAAAHSYNQIEQVVNLMSDAI